MKNQLLVPSKGNSPKLHSQLPSPGSFDPEAMGKKQPVGKTIRALIYLIFDSQGFPCPHYVTLPPRGATEFDDRSHLIPVAAPGESAPMMIWSTVGLKGRCLVVVQKQSHHFYALLTFNRDSDDEYDLVSFDCQEKAFVWARQQRVHVEIVSLRFVPNMAVTKL